MHNACLSLEGISKHFGSLNVLRSVSLRVEAGERRAILGPNGAGKTTLFEVISGRLPASEGRIKLFGEDITHLPARRRVSRGLGRTFQITNLFPSLTVLENLILGFQGRDHRAVTVHRSLSSYRRMFDRAEQLLDRWGPSAKRDVLVRNLSHGEQRELEILLSLTGDPKVLLLDEPTAGLSPAETLTVTSRIQALDGDVTILLIEHDMDVAFAVAEGITVLHQGRIVAEGPKEDVRGDPKVQEIYLGSLVDEDERP